MTTTKTTTKTNTTTTTHRPHRTRLAGAVAGTLLTGTLLTGTLAACGNEASPAAPPPADPPVDTLTNQYHALFPGCGLTADQAERIRAGKIRPQCTDPGQPSTQTPAPRPRRVLGHL